jgi:hypothetical protein
VTTEFRQINVDWNAEPNAPELSYARKGTTLWVRFHPNEFIFPHYSGVEWTALEFLHCRRFRFTSVNDEGWYLGQCRFSGIAPSWGEFYEVIGDFRESHCDVPWAQLDAAGGSRNFLFYLRDVTLEVTAETARLAAPPPQLDFEEPCFDA